MRSENEAIKRLTSVNSKVSCHYFIKKSGEIIQMVPDKYIAWHAGKSNWGKFKSINKFSIGIEIQNSGHDNSYKKFKPVQIEKILFLIKFLKKKFNIKKKYILGHSDISYDRKKDPGEKFPWKILSNYNLVHWHKIPKKKLKKMRKKKISKTKKKIFFHNLKKIGYFIKKKNINNVKLIKAFQRKYRQDLVDGILDEECFYISKKLNKH